MNQILPLKCAKCGDEINLMYFHNCSKSSHNSQTENPRLKTSVKLVLGIFVFGLSSIIIGLSAQYMGYDEEIIQYLIILNLIYSLILLAGLHYLLKYGSLIATIISVIIPASLTIVVSIIDFLLQTKIVLQLYVGIPLLIGTCLKIYFDLAYKKNG